eukprot:4732695-Prymnesium_polylepis.1
MATMRRPSWSSGASIWCVCWRRTWCSRPTRATLVPQWAAPQSRTSCGQRWGGPLPRPRGGVLRAHLPGGGARADTRQCTRRHAARPAVVRAREAHTHVAARDDSERNAAPRAHVRTSQVMKYSPTHPKWANRDRFVLSNGHACALQYCMLHLTGYNLSLDDLR